MFHETFFKLKHIPDFKTKSNFISFEMKIRIYAFKHNLKDRHYLKNLKEYLGKKCMLILYEHTLTSFPQHD